jgi:mRNA turnover protein 4
MEPQLRSLGMPTFLDKGIVTIHNDYTVCKPGDVLTPNQAQLLKLFLFETADFQVKLTHHFYDGKLDAL